MSLLAFSYFHKPFSFRLLAEEIQRFPSACKNWGEGLSQIPLATKKKIANISSQTQFFHIKMFNFFLLGRGGGGSTDICHLVHFAFEKFITSLIQTSFNKMSNSCTQANIGKSQLNYFQHIKFSISIQRKESWKGKERKATNKR